MISNRMTRGTLGIFALAALAALAQACTGAGALVGGECANGWLECDGRCVDWRSDPNNCGGCDVQCGPYACVHGVCAWPADSSAPPDDGAAGSGGDPWDSGSGGIDGGAAGQAGSGGSPCPVGEALCGTECVDLGTDPEHCGACDTSCGPDQLCDPTGAGTGPGCVCSDPSLTVCNGVCVDLTTDPDHCGSCSAVCDATEQSCLPDPYGSGPACVCDDPNLTVCYGHCRDLLSDSNHCGSCDNVCDPIQEDCVPSGDSAECVAFCDPPQTACLGPNGRFCTNLQDDWENCGACGNVCSFSGLCQAGVCRDGIAGHVIVIGMDFRYWSQASSPARILQNAVLLPAPAANPVHVLEWAELADNAANGSVEQVRGLLQWASSDSGFEVTLETLPDSTSLSTMLSIDEHHVLLVHDQSQGQPTDLASIGDLWAQTLNNYTRAGGVVIVLATDYTPSGDPGMSSFLQSSGLCPEVVDIAPSTWHTLTMTGPGSAIAKSVATQFLALPRTVAFEVGPLNPNTAVVVADEASGTARPVIIHKTVVP